MSIERRLSFTSVDSWYAADFDARYGKDGWSRLTDEEWAALPWKEPTVVTFTDNDRLDQYHTLVKWERTHEQPIRNVTLEEREIPDPRDGWRFVTYSDA